jgi:tripartite-type tricarboxylate transporter receptor subunit TctC
MLRRLPLPNNAGTFEGEKMRHCLATWAVWVACALPIAPIPALAQAGSYPAKPIRVIVPFPAGGTNDSIARIVAQKLGARLGQPVIVEDVPGAGGNIGSAQFARSDADGYTLMVASPGPLTISFNLYPKLNYDARKFVPVSMIADMPNVLAVGPSVPARNISELIAYAKANPGKLSFASQGNGTTSHLSGILFQSLTGIEMVHVPYRGSTPALNDIMGSKVDLMFDNVTTTLPFHKAGRVHILAVATKKRTTSMPDVPTMAEAGVPNFESGAWVAMIAPEGTPAAIAQRLSKEIAAIIAEPEVVRQFAVFGADPIGSTPASLGATMRDEAARWKRVIDAAHVTID